MEIDYVGVSAYSCQQHSCIVGKWNREDFIHKITISNVSTISISIITLTIHIETIRFYHHSPIIIGHQHAYLNFNLKGKFFSQPQLINRWNLNRFVVIINMARLVLSDLCRCPIDYHKNVYGRSHVVLLMPLFFFLLLIETNVRLCDVRHRWIPSKTIKIVKWATLTKKFLFRCQCAFVDV